MSETVTYQQLLEAAQKRRQQAKKLRAQGKKPAEIGRLLGVSRQRVEQMVASK